MDFASSDVYVTASASQPEEQFSLEQSSQVSSQQKPGDLATYTAHYDKNIPCVLMDIKSGNPGRVSLDDNKTQLFLFARPSDTEVIYVIPRERISSFPQLPTSKNLLDIYFPRYLRSMLPFSWTKDTWVTLLEQIANAEALKNPNTGVITTWSQTYIPFMDGVHQFNHPTHLIAADALIRLEAITTPLLHLTGPAFLRFDFTEFQPLEGDLVAVRETIEDSIPHSTSTRKVTPDKRIIQHKVSNSYSHVTHAFRPVERWDFCIYEQPDTDQITIYSRESQRLPTSEAVGTNHKWAPGRTEGSSFSTLPPRQGWKAGAGIINFIRDNWETSQQASVQAMDYRKVSDMVPDIDDQMEREEPTATKNSDTQIDLRRQQKLICIAYNSLARQNTSLTRLVMLSSNHHQSHPYGDAVAVSINKNMSDWEDERIESWLFSPSSSDSRTSNCVIVRFCRRDIAQRSSDSLHFPLDSKTTTVPVTDHLVFFWGFSSFNHYLPTKMLFCPSEHVKWPSAVYKEYQRTAEDTPIAKFDILTLKEFSKKYETVSLRKSEYDFWQTLSTIQAALGKVLIGTESKKDFLHVDATRYLTTWSSILQAAVTHGYGILRSRNSEASRRHSDREFCTLTKRAYAIQVSVAVKGRRLSKADLEAACDAQEMLNAQKQTTTPNDDARHYAQKAMMSMGMKRLEELAEDHGIEPGKTKELCARNLLEIHGMLQCVKTEALTQKKMTELSKVEKDNEGSAIKLFGKVAVLKVLKDKDDVRQRLV